MLPSRTAALVVLLAVGLAAPIAVGTVAGQNVTLTVEVIDQRAEPISGVQVTASWDDGSITEQTRANGQALVDVPEGADIEIDVSGSSYMRNYPYEVDDATTGEVTVAVSEQGQARVVVTDEDGPVRGANVSLQSSERTVASSETNADGVARSGNVEQGTYRLRVSKPGYMRHSERLTVDAVTQHEVTLEEAIVDLDVTVQDTNFDPPADVENATVEIAPTGVTLVTLGNGEASTSVAANRDYDVTVSRDGFGEVTREVSVGEEDTNLTVNLSRAPALDVTAGQDAIVVGQTTQVTVTDEYERAIEDAPITIDGDEVARTNAEGRADVAIESAGDVTISVEHDGMTATVTVEGVRSGEADGPNGSNQSTDGGFGPGFGPATALVGFALAVLASLVLGRRR